LGLIIDVLIAYIIKQVVRLHRTWGSSGWKRVEAKINSSVLGGGWVWNCPTVEIAYTYGFDGQTYRGLDRKPYFFDGPAEVRVTRFKPGETAIVRVNPQQPQTSVLVHDDQADVIH
jgi:hypothetical protein